MRELMKAYEFLLDMLFPLDPEVRRLESMTPGELVGAARGLERGREVPDGIILFEYQDSLVKRAITEAKFHGNRRIARLLGEAVRDVLMAELIERKAFENFSDPILVSIPMTKRSLRARGWDQCHLMLAPVIAAASDLGIESRLDVMKKIRETPDQVGMDKKERLANLRGSLVADERVVRGRNVIVFDDVVTTGATWEEAKRALRSAGARKVILLAVAH